MSAPLRVPTLVVIGGGEVGAASVRQLLRARAAGRLETRRILVVDRDPACPAARAAAPVRLETADWAAWLEQHLGGLGPADQLVPYHWAPHLLFTWLVGQALRAGGLVSDGPPLPPRGLPFERSSSAGDRALSYASWACPPLCIEPRLCPHTRGPRDWSLAGDLTAAPAASSWDEALVFRCLHLVYGVASVPVAAALAARDRVVAGLARGPRSFLVATASHCHGLARVLRVSPGPGARPECRGDLLDCREEVTWPNS